MTANERRELEKEYISRKREFKLEDLMNEFGKSQSTIWRDIQILKGEPYYIPIESMQGHEGGYVVMYGWRADRKYLKPKQSELLHRMLLTELQSEDLETLQSIINDFDVPAV